LFKLLKSESYGVIFAWLELLFYLVVKMDGYESKGADSGPRCVS